MQVTLNCVQVILGNLALFGAASVIDVGCGAGHPMNALSVNHLVRVYISLNQVKPVSGDVARIKASGEHPPIAGSFFDVAVSTYVCEHVLDE